MTDTPITTAREMCEAAARAVGDLRGRDVPRRDAEDAGEGYDLAIDEAQAAICGLASRIPEPGEDDVERVARAIRNSAQYSDDAWEDLPSGNRDHWLDLARAALSAMRPAPAEGWRLVPVEPTRAMLDAAGSSMFPKGQDYLDKCARLQWAAMLAAAPAQGGEGEPLTMEEALRLAAKGDMTPDMLAAQRKSWVRGMTAKCEHGEIDYEQCGECRKAAQGGEK